MNRFLWLHPWDLEGWEPDEILDEIAETGFREVRLALAYHGGRLLLPRNRRHLVYGQHDGAVYFQPSRKQYGLLQPVIGRHTEVVEKFLAAAGSRKFAIRAWLVLCHNDWLGTRHPELCIPNYRQEPYSYALRPAQPDVQHLCARPDRGCLAIIRGYRPRPGGSQLHGLTSTTRYTINAPSQRPPS